MDGSAETAIAVDWNATIVDSGEAPPEPPSEDDLWVGQVHFWIEGVAQGIVGLIGLVGKSKIRWYHVLMATGCPTGNGEKLNNSQ